MSLLSYYCNKFSKIAPVFTKYHITLYIVIISVFTPALYADDELEENVKLNKSVVRSINTNETYNSNSGIINSEIIETNPNANNDISSVLRVLPNVQTNNASMTSSSPGEVNPANISISGGLPYQNSFLLDGFDINNDLDPAGSSSNTQPRQRGGQSQGLNIDASLLDSVIVQDSNISAMYGRFSGGVIEANVRRPKRPSGDGLLFGDDGLYGWHGGVSYQITSSDLTTYHIPKAQEELFKYSSNENLQPNFTKHAIRANLEGYITKNLGMIASFSTIRSYIPLQIYSNGANSQKQDQKRISDNYYAKFYYDPSENLSIEASLAYMPSRNTYFTPNFKNSRYRMQSGGIQSAVSAKWQTQIGLWTNSVSYSRLENSRNSDVNYYSLLNGADGQFGDVRQTQDNMAFKSDMLFETIIFGDFYQTFRTGFDVMYQQATRDRTEDSHMYIFNGNPVNIAANQSWNGQPDSFGFISSNNTQYYDTMGIIKKHKGQFDTFTYGIYAEDDSKLYFKDKGILYARLGLRLDGDNYLNKHKLAPRFTLSYEAPWNEEYKTKFTIGANRYYARNLLSYRFYSDAVNNRLAYYRTGPNDVPPLAPPAQPPPHPGGGGNYCTPASNGVVQGSGTKLRDLDVPYDDELMFGITQNLGYIFVVNLKYIHRDGRNQVMQKTIYNNNTPSYIWSNDGNTKSNIITISLQNVVPIYTAGLQHFYLLAIDYIDTKRNFDAYSADIDNETIVTYNAQATTFAKMPAQKINQPLTAKLTTSHAYMFSKSKIIWSNFFKLKGSYERIVLENYNPNANQTQNYVDKTFKSTFLWDTRIGFEKTIWRKNILFVNLDIYNVLNMKNETALSAADGMYLYNVPSQMAVSMYELGRQFWVQTGYKF